MYSRFCLVMALSLAAAAVCVPVMITNRYDGRKAHVSVKRTFLIGTAVMYIVIWINQGGSAWCSRG
jgi:hypothetical protein